MFAVPTGVIIVAIFLVLYRAVSGPGVFNRTLAVNVIGTKTIVLITLIGFFNGYLHFLDIALAYALINFLGTLAILKYIKTGGVE